MGDVLRCTPVLKKRVKKNAKTETSGINPLNAELNPICHLLALLGTHHILHVSRIRVKYSCDLTDQL